MFTTIKHFVIGAVAVAATFVISSTVGLYTLAGFTVYAILALFAEKTGNTALLTLGMLIDFVAWVAAIVSVGFGVVAIAFLVRAFTACTLAIIFA